MEKTTESQCQVRGPREVTVPAGTFATLEVFCRHGGRFETLYYAPDVRNTVMELRDVDGRMEKKELIAYRLASLGATPATMPTTTLMPGDAAPQAASVEAEPLTMPEAAPSPQAAQPGREVAPISGPGWTLQLAALSSRDAADKAWEQWSQSVRAALPNVQPTIAQGDGLWRLTAGRFASRVEAIAACEKLKGSGVQCFPKQL